MTPSKDVSRQANPLPLVDLAELGHHPQVEALIEHALELAKDNERLRAVVDVVKDFDDPPTEEQLDALSVVLSHLEKGIPASEVFGD